MPYALPDEKTSGFLSKKDVKLWAFDSSAERTHSVADVIMIYQEEFLYFFVQVFDKYVKERADEERKEKKAKAKEMKESFRLLCEEARVSSKTSYSDFTK